MRSGNPVLREKAFRDLPATGEQMTINGTIAHTGILLLLALITGGWTWHHFALVAQQSGPAAGMAAISLYLGGGLIAGLVLALLTCFVSRWASITAPLYALAEGCVLGGISAIFNLKYPGIVLQAVMLTAGVLAVMLFLYRSGVIKVTNKFRLGVVAATAAIALLYLVDMGLRAFTSVQISFIHESGAPGIGFSLLVVGLAALNLVLDFNMIEHAVRQGAPKYMEWYGAFALMVTLVWLYMEMLRLLSKARR